MKKYVLLALVLLSYFHGFSQQLLWYKSVGSSTSPTQQVYEYAVLNDGGYIALFRVDQQTVDIARYNSQGDQVWNIPLPVTFRTQDFWHEMLKVVPGGILLTGREYSPDTTRLVLMKVNFQGTIVWTKIIPTGRTHSSGCDLHIRSSNEYVLLATGHNQNQTLGSGGGHKPIYIGLDSLGNVLWRKINLTPLGTIDQPVSIIPYSPNRYIFTGSTGIGFTTTPTADVRLTKTDLEGNVIQQVLLVDTAAPNGYATLFGSFIPTSDGNIVFSGFNYAQNTNLPERYVVVSKIDTSLNLLWTVSYPELGGSFEYNKLHELANGNILVVSQKCFTNKITLLTISPQGQKLDSTNVTLPTTTVWSGSLSSSFLHPDGSLFFGGWDSMVKFGNVGSPTTSTGMVEEVALSSELGNIYPNPANSLITIPYQLVEGTVNAKLQITEINTGRMVKQLSLDIDEKQVNLDIPQLQSGIYIYSVIADGLSIGSKKLGIIK